MVLCSLSSFKFVFLFFNGFLICLSHFSTCQQYSNPENPVISQYPGMRIVNNSGQNIEVYIENQQNSNSIETIKTPKPPKMPLTPKVSKNPKYKNSKTVPDAPNVNNLKLEKKPDDSFPKESHELEPQTENSSNELHMQKERGEYSEIESGSDDDEPQYRPKYPEYESSESNDQEDSSEEATDGPKIQPIIKP